MFKKLIVLVFLVGFASECYAWPAYTYRTDRVTPAYLYGYGGNYGYGYYGGCNHYHYQVPAVVPYYGGAIGWDWQPIR
ncbi:hypothetical protein [Bythopirellula polymerisocia]|uniref:Uncharacterized protein n=1 Tax=Bythopirellula polymerisocia TaxID=2528003 RepID=A0A5C6CYE4_9BACT|nr:hypothetical protein [Bythopirellula polymerisocia]TWU29642.1 hypothetical protein Pla144_04210 [Bythopirellula polymerisocia]